MTKEQLLALDTIIASFADSEGVLWLPQKEPDGDNGWTTVWYKWDVEKGMWDLADEDPEEDLELQYDPYL